MKQQLPSILSEADSQEAFCTAWSLRGYQGLIKHEASAKELVAVAQKHFEKFGRKSERAHCQAFYYCYGNSVEIKLPNWWSYSGPFVVPEGWTS